MCQLSPVPFHGDTIFCIDYQNQPFTPMRPIVENMGLDWGGQAVKLKANKERWTVEMISTVAQDGVEREMLSMPVRKLPAWLNSINPKKVRPELRPKIELYQAESDDALWNYWMNGRAERSVLATASPDAPITPDQQCTLQAIVKGKVEAIPADTRPKGLYPKIWSRFNNRFRLARYAQLPQSRMSEAIDYLMKMELAPMPLPPTVKESLTVAPEALPFRSEFPADMDAGCKDALRKIRSIMDSMLAAREAVRIFCYPQPVNMNRPRMERLTHNARHDFYAAALDCLSVAYNALEAGYRLDRLSGRG